jgi:hypothetical protein
MSMERAVGKVCDGLEDKRSMQRKGQEDLLRSIQSRDADSAMRIAQVAPLYERVPPALYGGTERVVSYLTEELVRRGHLLIMSVRTATDLSASTRPSASHRFLTRRASLVP